MTEKPPPFHARLLAWWDRHGRHDLPWQHPRSPYRVWISEIMLQQTQVATVIPYFEAWMARFPDLATLAAADLDEVLAAWSGLGYYARARNLHRAAQICVREHGGQLPDQPDELAALPGIGASTANAIVAQAHDRPLPILDGNAKRVLARHAAIEGWPGQASVLKALWQAAETRLPPGRGADYTQAIMDLGATVCSRAAPACGDCPVQVDCRALEKDEVARYPARKPRSRVVEQNLYLLLLRRADGSVLLERRPPAGIWGGLWCPPSAATAGELTMRFGLRPDALEPLPSFQHLLTHRRLTIHGLLGAGDDIHATRDAGQKWLAPGMAGSVGLPKPVADLLGRL